VLAIVLAVTEPNKVPFYIAGGVLTLWAVVLAGIGLTQPEFPFSDRGARGVIALSGLLIVIAIGTAVTSG